MNVFSCLEIALGKVAFLKEKEKTDLKVHAADALLKMT